MVSCYRLLGVRSFVLKVRSWSDNDVPENLYQMNIILCLDQKGQSPKAQLLPSKVPVLAKRRQISVGSSFRARFPHPSHPRGNQTSNPTGPQSPQVTQTGRPVLTGQADGTAIRSQR